MSYLESRPLPPIALQAAISRVAADLRVTVITDYPHPWNAHECMAIVCEEGMAAKVIEAARAAGVTAEAKIEPRGMGVAVFWPALVPATARRSMPSEELHPTP